MNPVIEAWQHPEDRDAPIALLIHGTGSNPDFVHRTFCTSTHARGYSLASYRLRGHGPGAEAPPYSFAQHLEDLVDVLGALRPNILGGISLGAHLSASAAATGQLPETVAGLLLALPAWMGPPETVAHANAVQADRIAELGTAECLRRLDADLKGTDVHWVYDEMARTWPEHLEGNFEAILRATAASAAPTATQLGQIALPVGLSASEDDPLHPFTVAEHWQRALARAQIRGHSMAEFGRDRGLLGEHAWVALEAASI